ncbi:MAG: TonB-dependent receptor [Rickettsiales bacterium]
MLRSRLFAVFSTVAFCYAPPAFASSSEDAEVEKLLSLSLEELGNVTVTSVSKKSEPENEAAAAVFVITQDEIRRSSATNIPEMLRMVPGISVAQSGSNNWTVTSRGFNSQFANKLLVLIDGRTVYSPLFSGVIWDSQDVMLEDIDRIEIVRGPGATLWGANAVNGVINIITKSARDTQGGLATATAGNQMIGGAVRYGSKIADGSYARTYAKYNDYDDQYNTDGSDAGDSWRKKQAGFRSDMKLSADDKLTVQGDIYTIDEDDPFIFPDLTSGTYYSSSKGFKLKGGNILTRWEKKHSKDSETTLQAYFDNASSETLFFNDTANTADIEFQHFWSGWERQEFIWGGGYRFINDKNDPISAQYNLSPRTRNDNLFNAFFQDKIALIPSELFLTLGSKFEHNDYSGFEVQPSVRMSWVPSYTQTVWGAISRAVHTPSRFDADGQLSYAILPPTATVPIPTLIESEGNDRLDSEELISYELGYRFQPIKNASVDIAGYYNDYNKLNIDTLGNPTVFGTYVLQPLIAQNANKASSFGGEVLVRYDVNSSWRLTGSYSYLNLKFDDKSKIVSSLLGKNPKNMFNVSSTYLFQNKIEMNNALYAVSELHGIDIPAYYRFDTKLSYPLTDSVKVSLVGQNLFDHRHKEFSPFLYQTQTEIGRSIYGGVSYKF